MCKSLRTDKTTHSCNCTYAGLRAGAFEKGPKHKRSWIFFKFQKSQQNEISWSPLDQMLKLKLAVSFFGENGEWYGGLPLQPPPDQPSDCYSLIQDAWVPEGELNKESNGKRKRKLASVEVSTLYK